LSGGAQVSLRVLLTTRRLGIDELSEFIGAGDAGAGAKVLVVLFTQVSAQPRLRDPLANLAVGKSRQEDQVERPRVGQVLDVVV